MRDFRLRLSVAWALLLDRYTSGEQGRVLWVWSKPKVTMLVGPYLHASECRYALSTREAQPSAEPMDDAQLALSNALSMNPPEDQWVDVPVWAAKLLREIYTSEWVCLPLELRGKVEEFFAALQQGDE